MDKVLPFGLAIIVFILVWAALLQIPYLESISSSKIIIYSSISLFISIVVFVMFAAVYRFENITVPKEALKSEFCITYENILHL